MQLRKHQNNHIVTRLYPYTHFTGLAFLSRTVETSSQSHSTPSHRHNEAGQENEFCRDDNLNFYVKRRPQSNSENYAPSLINSRTSVHLNHNKERLFKISTLLAIVCFTEILSWIVIERFFPRYEIVRQMLTGTIKCRLLWLCLFITRRVY